MSDLICREALLEKYDAAHEGPPGGARKLIEEAPAVSLEDALKAQASTIILFRSPAADDPGNNNCASGMFEGNTESLIVGLSCLIEQMADSIAMAPEGIKISFVYSLYAACNRAIEVFEA